jgi:hypothetical protein
MRRAMRDRQGRRPGRAAIKTPPKRGGVCFGNEIDAVSSNSSCKRCRCKSCGRSCRTGRRWRRLPVVKARQEQERVSSLCPRLLCHRVNAGQGQIGDRPWPALGCRLWRCPIT